MSRNENPKKTGTREWSDDSFNFITGCRYNCRYCYARKMAVRFGRLNGDWSEMTPVNNWESRMRKTMEKCDKTVMVPTTHDLYPEFNELNLAVLKSLTMVYRRVLVVTKGSPAAVDYLTHNLRRWSDEMAARFEFRFTITSHQEELVSYWEPGAPSLHDRFRSMTFAIQRGFKVSVSIEPFLSEPRNLIDILPEGVSEIWVGIMDQPPREHPRFKSLYSRENLLNIAYDLADDDRVKFKDRFRKRTGML